jgi:hypothetical protein
MALCALKIVSECLGGKAALVYNMLLSNDLYSKESGIKVVDLNSLRVSWCGLRGGILGKLNPQNGEGEINGVN